MAASTPADKLVLTADTRLSDEQVKAIDAEWAAELHALEAAGIVAPGKARELSPAELEDAIAKLPEGWEPATPILNLGDEEADSADEPDPTPVMPDLDMSAVEAMIVAKMGDLTDSDALRAHVVKIVHEELGGELGERITRNVRKMVRREINRVMTSRDLSGD